MQQSQMTDCSAAQRMGCLFYGNSFDTAASSFPVVAMNTPVCLEQDALFSGQVIPNMLRLSGKITLKWQT